jgi:tetratricopeptide (TPR) repeat protein
VGLYCYRQNEVPGSICRVSSSHLPSPSAALADRHGAETSASFPPATLEVFAAISVGFQDVKSLQAPTKHDTGFAGMDIRKTLIAVAIGLAAMVVHGRALQCDFVNHDDPTYVTRNPHVLDGPSPANVWWAFTTFQAANYHPLTWLSLQLDAWLHGPEAWAFHATNVILHGLNAACLFFLFASLTGQTLLSAIVALLFAVHPLHVESVAWISERKDVLSTFFALLSLLAYTAYARKPCLMSYLSAFGALTLSLLAKPMYVTLPAFMVLIDWWPLGRLKRPWHTLILEKLPFICLALASCYVTVLAQRQGEAIAALSPGGRLRNALDAYVRYIGKSFWPADLCILYPLHDVSVARTTLDAAILIAISWAAWINAGKRPYLLFGWLWFLAMLLPVVGLVQVGNQALADRYTYLSQTGLTIMVVWSAAALLAYRPGTLPLAMCGVGACLLILAVLSFHQIQFWRDSVNLWQRAIDVTTDNYQAHNNLGEAFSSRATAVAASNDLLRRKFLDEAVREYSCALEIRPGLWLAQYNRGVALAQESRFLEAMGDFSTALKSNDKFAPAHFNLALAAGRFHQPAVACDHFVKALSFEPGQAPRESWLQTATQYARRLATDPEAHHRDGIRALALAAQLDDMTSHRRPEVLEALAAAQAECGRFGQAIATLGSASALPLSPETKAVIDHDVSLYRAHKPLRSTTGVP